MFDSQSVFQFWRNPRAVTPVLLLVMAILTYRHFALIHHHAVNLLYWDQWDYYSPMFSRASWWTLFNWQYGVHRQGIGFWLTRIISDWTGWDTRIEAFFVGGLVFAAMLLAIWLKRRLFGELAFSDLAIPLAMLITAQFQTFVGALNPSPQAFPLLLLILFCLGWTVVNAWLKYSLLVVINFLLLYTGYGILMGVLTPVVLAIDCFDQQSRKSKWLCPALALIAALISVGWFLHGYVFVASGAPTAKLWQYPLFMCLMFARFVRAETGTITWLSYLAFTFGTAIFLSVISVFLVHLKRGLRLSNPVSGTIVILLGYCLLFVAATAIGRTGQGLNVSQSSRYLTLMVPGFLGLYFHLLTLEPSRLRQSYLAAFLLLLLPGHLPLRLGDTHPAAYFSRNKLAWKECFLRTENPDHCNQLTGFGVLSAMEPGVLQSRLDFMKRNRLNLYSELGNQP